MRRYIVLLLITGTVWAQTGLDKLVLKDGTIYLGEYSKIEKNKVYFKPSEGFAFQGVSISQIKSLKLKDGKTIIKDEYEKIRTILDYENLSIEDKAIYDAKKDAKKWLFLFPATVLTLAASSGSYFFLTGHHPLESPTASIIAVFGLFGSYPFFRELNDKNVEKMSTDEYVIYQPTYSNEYRKIKYNNIQKSFLATGIAGSLGTFIFIGMVQSGLGGGPSFPLP